MITTRTALTANAPFTLEAVKLFLRIDHDDEDTSLATLAASAALEIEGAAQVALLAQTITCALQEWTAATPLPVGPLWGAGLEDNPVTVQTRAEDGTLATLTSGWWVEGGRHPVLHLSADLLATLQGTAAALVVTYPAGFGETAATIPADLAHAIADHSARLYDMRGDTEAGSVHLSPAARRTVARYRKVRA